MISKKTIKTQAVIFMTAFVVCCAHDARDKEITILFSHLIQGELYPCGCVPPYLGGVAKRAKLILDEKIKGNTLVIDAGNMLFNEAQLRQDERDRWAIDADVILHSYSQVGADALNIGSKDLAYNLEFLITKQKEYSLPFTSASIKKNEEYVFEPFIIKNIRDVSVGFIGLTSLTPKLVSDLDLTVVPPAEATSVVLKQLEKFGIDIVVLLSDLSEQNLKDILSQFDAKIDYAISAYDYFEDRSRHRIFPDTNTPVLNSGERGQELGYLTIDVKNLSNFILGSKRIYDAISDDPRTQEFLKIAKDSSLAWEDLNAVSKRSDYVSHLACAGCHPEQYAHWQTTLHSFAYRNLKDTRKFGQENEEKNRKCIPCHAVGFKLPGGFISPLRVGNLAGVQCESCHGMAKWHVWQQGGLATKDTIDFMWRQNDHYIADLRKKVAWKAADFGDTLSYSEVKLIRKQVPEEICRTCHVPPHDNFFIYSEKVKLGDCLPGDYISAKVQ